MLYFSTISTFLAMQLAETVLAVGRVIISYWLVSIDLPSTVSWTLPKSIHLLDAIIPKSFLSTLFTVLPAYILLYSPYKL